MTSRPAQRTDRGRGGLRRAGLLVGGWVLLVALQVGWGLALTGPLADSLGVRENHLERWFVSHRSASLNAAAEAVSLLGETWTAFILGPVLVGFAWWWLRDLRVVAFMAAALLGEIGAYLLTVSLVSRPRPPVHLLDQGLDPLHSYPSGHVAAAVAMYGGLAVILWRYGHGRARWLVALLVAFPPLVALARLYLGVHHLSDVASSVVFMSLWLAFAAHVLLPTSTPRRTTA